MNFIFQKDSLFIILLFSILAGQLIKIPLFGSQPPLLDLIVGIIDMWGLYKLKFHLKNPPNFIKIAILFILIACFSLIFTRLKLSQPEILVSFFYTVRFFIYILFGLLIYSGAYPNLSKTIPKLLIFSGIGLSILGILQFLTFPDLSFLSILGWDPHFFRTVSTFLDPNFAGAYFVLTLLLLTSLREVTQANERVVIGFWIILYLALLTTFSRSSYGMFLISFLTLSYFLKSWKVAIVSIILFLGLLIGFQIYSQAVAKPRGVSREQSASFRINTWQQGLTLFQNHPILGVGFNTYRFALKQYNLAPENIIESRGGSTNDSSLLFVASTTGILGLISYMAFLITIFIRGLHTDKLLSSAILGLLAHSTFANSLFYPHILVWIILLASSNSKFPLEKGQKR